MALKPPNHEARENGDGLMNASAAAKAAGWEAKDGGQRLDDSDIKTQYRADCEVERTRTNDYHIDLQSETRSQPNALAYWRHDSIVSRLIYLLP